MNEGLIAPLKMYSSMTFFVKKLKSLVISQHPAEVQTQNSFTVFLSKYRKNGVNLAFELFLHTNCQEQSQLTCDQTCLTLHSVVSFIVGV